MRFFKYIYREQSIARKIIIALSFLSLIFLIAEFSLKFIGFDDEPIIIYDSKIEYYAQPNRCYKRFFNVICYNKFAMRSDEIRSKGKKFLVIGDSVVNGGSFVDQSDTITALSQKNLEIYFPHIQALNISAGSWGPKNQLEYLNRFGFFESRDVFLVISSHDLYDIPVFLPIENDRKYNFSIIYLYYKIFKRNDVDLSKFESENYIKNAQVIGKFDLLNLTRLICKNSENFNVLIHPEIREIRENSEKYDNLLKYLNSINNEYCKFDITEMRNETGLDENSFRDYIHINEKGNKIYAKTIYSLFTLNNK